MYRMVSCSQRKLFLRWLRWACRHQHSRPACNVCRQVAQDKDMHWQYLRVCRHVSTGMASPALHSRFVQLSSHFGFNKPGAMALQRMFREPNSSATDLVNPKSGFGCCIIGLTRIAFHPNYRTHVDDWPWRCLSMVRCTALKCWKPISNLLRSLCRNPLWNSHQQVIPL